MDETQAQPKQGGMGIWPLVIIVLIAVGGGAYFFLNQQKAPDSTPAVPNAMEQQEPTSSPEVTGAMESAATEITVEGGMFYFKPNEIKVKKGEKVKITFNNVKGMHDFVIDEFNVKTEVIGADQTATVEFTPDKAGTYEYYCSVGSHRQQGMKGTLIVEE